MSSYYSTLIYGNESFGGYISVDGARATTVRHNLTCRIAPSPHKFKKTVAILLVLVLCVALCSCGGDMLEGVYLGEDGDVWEFKCDGTCVAFYDGIQLSGTYKKSENGWTVRVGFGIFYEDCEIEKNGRNLIIDGDLYVKQ